MPHAIRRARRAFLWVGLIVPLTITLLGAAVILSWLPQIPDPAATHWSGDGPDGFAPRWVLLVSPGIALLMVVAFAALGWFAHRVPREYLSGGGGVVADADGTPQWSSAARFLGATNLGLAAMFALVGIASAGVQRGLADAADAPDIGIYAFIGFGLLLVCTALGWFLQPRVPAVAGRLVTSPAAEPGESTQWEGSASMSPGGIVTLAVSLLVLLVVSVTGFVAGAVFGWIMMTLFLVMALLIAAMFVFHVRVDETGLLVRSALGWPRTRIPASEVESVRVVQISPFGEFGGWGWRWGLDGRRGVVLRAGEGIEVRRTDAKTFVMTIDDASGAAAALAAAAQAVDS